MTEKLTLEGIRKFWTEQANLHGQSPAASWSDRHAIEMEIREIASRLEEGTRVLDVGCANGYSTAQLASLRAVSLRGVDYIPEMIDQARARMAGLEGKLLGSVEFDVGDIMKLAEPDGAYDAAVVIRVVINLGEWENQIRAIRECARILKPGGRLLLSEATLQGWNRLNELRREWGLDDIPMPSFNNYLDEERVARELRGELELVDLVNFSSTYFVGTRILKPLLDKALGGRVNVAEPEMHWNRWFSMLPAAGDYGTQKLFVLRKPE